MSSFYKDKWITPPANKEVPLNYSQLLAVMLRGKQYFIMEEIFLVNIRYFLSHPVNVFLHKFVSSPSPRNLIGKVLCLLVCLSPKAEPLRSFYVQITQMEIPPDTQNNK